MPTAEYRLQQLATQMLSVLSEGSASGEVTGSSERPVDRPAVEGVVGWLRSWMDGRGVSVDEAKAAVRSAVSISLGGAHRLLDGLVVISAGSGEQAELRVSAVYEDGESDGYPLHLHISEVSPGSSGAVSGALVDSTNAPVTEPEAVREVADELERMKEQLIHQEKLASLGHLTAGIAHEIKNPLNFVTNFADLSVELIEELREALAAGDDVEDLLADLEENVRQIAKHGSRADSIARSMMQHASGGVSERLPTEVNDLVDEFVSLAYHGMRARRPGFNVDVDVAYGEEVRSVDMVREDIGRVLLNLLGNAFDALFEKAAAVEGFRPRVAVMTRRLGDEVEIRIEDNGTGIRAEVLPGLFKPFVTTKPVGHGTGLGLSMSRDIVGEHGGTLTVGEAAVGAAFVIRLPARVG